MIVVAYSTSRKHTQETEIWPVLDQQKTSSDGRRSHRRVSNANAAQLLKVRLTVSVAGFDKLTTAPQVEGAPGTPIAQGAWPKQEEVAQRLFERTNEVLGNISNFKGVEFLVLTPAFQTLQQQTINRLAQYGVVPEHKAASECVIMYIQSAKHDQLFESFKTRVGENKECLFVIVADECHYGCTIGGAHDKYVNDAGLHLCDNFVLLGVRCEGREMRGGCCCTRDCFLCADLRYKE